MAGRGRVYVSPTAWTNESDVIGLSIGYQGETRDGMGIHHFTYFNERLNRRISYDSVRINGEYHYILGSGHEVDQNTNQKIRWEPYVNEVTWREALLKYSNQLT